MEGGKFLHYPDASPVFMQLEYIEDCWFIAVLPVMEAGCFRLFYDLALDRRCGRYQPFCLCRTSKYGMCNRFSLADLFSDITAIKGQV